jgi:hypothetical protein
MPEKPEETQPDAIDDEDLEDVTGGRIMAPRDNTVPLTGANGLPLDFPA